ncbi:hypothetical protein [Demequina sediminicola]|uniref:hypothetical protein n=1 Tax=Demequina sediminicola TaxID=1095026 RepID=UPI0007859B2E|nr:hypothetical protein [Demequina sediminicola]
MTQSHPRPVLGTVLGVLLGLTGMFLLWLLGVLPPDRLPLFGVLAVAIAVTGALSIQRLSAAKGAAVAIGVIAALCAGVAATGIPETVSGGALSDGCTLEVTSTSGAVVTPADTSATDPLDVARGEVLPWHGETADVPLGQRASAALVVGGWSFTLWNGSDINSDDTVIWEGDLDVSQLLDDVKDASGLELTGTFHVGGVIASDATSCEGDGYVRVAPEGPFSTALLIGVWVLLVAVVGGIVAMTVAVRRSFSETNTGDTTIDDEEGKDHSPETGESQR